MKYLRTAKKHYPGEDSFHPDGYRMLFLLVLSHKYQIAVDMQFVFKLNLLSNLRSKCYVLLRTSVVGVRVLDSQTREKSLIFSCLWSKRSVHNISHLVLMIATIYFLP